ncbi:MAG: hypothetical protein LYZ69_05095 [Nitrososphaerales archaeon]|nr:hypothetical protein [Nitrososphaerales archaeon]
MDARERAVWEDAEGNLSVPTSLAKGRSPQLRTSQLERGILLDYCEGARRDGVNCVVDRRRIEETRKTRRSLIFYETRIQGLGNIARELVLTAPYRRSEKMKRQVGRFKRFVGRRRKHMTRFVAEAREQTPFF